MPEAAFPEIDIEAVTLGYQPWGHPKHDILRIFSTLVLSDPGLTLESLTFGVRTFLNYDLGFILPEHIKGVREGKIGELRLVNSHALESDWEFLKLTDLYMNISDTLDSIMPSDQSKSCMELVEDFYDRYAEEDEEEQDSPAWRREREAYEKEVEEAFKAAGYVLERGECRPGEEGLVAVLRRVGVPRPTKSWIDVPKVSRLYGPCPVLGAFSSTE